MKKYRNKLELIAEVLKICKEGASKSQVMRQGKLSYKLLMFYSNICISNGWLKKAGYIYQTTSAGKLFLQKIIEMIEELRKASTFYQVTVKNIKELELRWIK